MKPAKEKIRVYYHFGNSYSAFILNTLEKIESPDVLIFSPDVVPIIDFDSEFENRTYITRELAFLSRHLDAIIIVFTRINLSKNGIISALIFEHGKLLGICEEILPHTKNEGGASVNFYDFDFGRIAILIYENASQLEFFQLAEAYDVDFVFSLESIADKKLATITNSYASKKLSVKPVLLCRNKMKTFSAAEIQNLGKKTVFADIVMQKQEKNQNFFKHIHNLIYTKLSF